MNPELEKLITLAAGDGIITDKEREIILRKAEALGVDPDEVEIYLENILSQTKVTKKEVTPSTKSRTLQCPNCGARISSAANIAFTTTCPDCGFVIDANSLRGDDELAKFKRDFEELTKKVSKILEKDPESISKKIDLRDKAANIITNFVLPLNKKVLLYFAPIAYAKSQGDDSWLREAWKAQYNGAIATLMTFSDFTPDEQRQLDQLRKIEKESEKKEKREMIWALIMIIIFAIFFISLVALINNN